MKKKKTDYYLLRKKSLSEGDLFVTDYLKLKREFEKQKLIIDVVLLSSLKRFAAFASFPQEDCNSREFKEK